MKLLIEKTTDANGRIFFRIRPSLLGKPFGYLNRNGSFFMFCGSDKFESVEEANEIINTFKRKKEIIN